MKNIVNDKEHCPQLGFGIMRFQDGNGNIDYETVNSCIEEYMKGAFCYFDVHPAYVCGNAQRILREYVVKKYPRNTYRIANKIPYYGINEYQDYGKIIRKELEECGVKYFDNYMLHALTKDVYAMHEKLGGFQFLKEAKKRGLAKRIGISFHDTPELLDEILTKHPEIEFVQLQINLFDWDSDVIASRRCYEIARMHEKEIIVMEPIKGGGLINASLSGKFTPSRVAEICLNFVGGLDGIKIILSGMTKLTHVKENRKTLAHINEEMWNNDEANQLREIYKNYNAIPCTGCGYCKRECPKQIAIPEIISLINAINNVGEDDTTAIGRHTIFYRGYIENEHNASKCISCKKCERHCPQKLEIHTLMKKAGMMFGESNSMSTRYTDERNAQIAIYLLKEHGIRKVVASPGTTNACLVASLQTDPFFTLYSAPDERSAAYIACGLSQESGEPVVLSCTGATSSRNYYPGLTEAFYSKIPIIAITSSQRSARIGHNFDQVTDRTCPPKDVVKLSVNAPFVRDGEDEWACEIAINRAILETKRHGNGPVHINLETMYSQNQITYLPKARVINRYFANDALPEIKASRVAVMVGSHVRWTPELTESVDKFCEKYNAIVLCDHTSNYHGRFKIFPNLFVVQKNNAFSYRTAELIIHIGNISSSEYEVRADDVWRVNPDGEIRDTYRKLTKVFEMSEEAFFNLYADNTQESVENEFFDICMREEKEIQKEIPDLPFSNPYMASIATPILPKDSILHLAIQNSLRSWNYFRIDESITAYANVGGFGIDGSLSTVLGNSLATDKLVFCVTGDLAFFYDMNSLGNRHINSRLRILLVNNGTGMQMQFSGSLPSRIGADKDSYIAASGHYGAKSSKLVRDYVENLGFRYLCAKNKKEYEDCIKIFCGKAENDSPILLEAFVDKSDEDLAYKLLSEIKGQGSSSKKPEKQNAIIPSERLRNVEDAEVVVFGTGAYFRENLVRIRLKYQLKYVCDNNPEKWNKEIAPGIMCISPEKLQELDDPFVLIAVVNASASMQITNQLIDLGIERFDHLENWLKYRRT